MQFVESFHKKATGSIAALCLFSAATCTLLTLPASAVTAPATLSQLEVSQNQFVQILYLSGKNLVFRSDSEDCEQKQTSFDKQKRLIKKTNHFFLSVTGDSESGYISEYKDTDTGVRLYSYQPDGRFLYNGFLTARKIE